MHQPPRRQICCNHCQDGFGDIKDTGKHRFQPSEVHKIQRTTRRIGVRHPPSSARRVQGSLHRQADLHVKVAIRLTGASGNGGGDGCEEASLEEREEEGECEGARAGRAAALEAAVARVAARVAATAAAWPGAPSSLAHGAVLAVAEKPEALGGEAESLAEGVRVGGRARTPRLHWGQTVAAVPHSHATPRFQAHGRSTRHEARETR